MNMPPAKVKMTITVGLQIAEYLEGLHRRLVQKMFEERRRPPSFQPIHERVAIETYLRRDGKDGLSHLLPQFLSLENLIKP